MSAGVPRPGAETAAERPTGTNPNETTIEAREALRRDLAATINQALDDWRRHEVTGWLQEYVADEVLARGYRLVAEDDTTVERLAVALHEAGCGCGMTLDEHQTAMRRDFDEEDPAYRAMARAAVRALREGQA